MASRMMARLKQDEDRIAAWHKQMAEAATERQAGLRAIVA